MTEPPASVGRYHVERLIAHGGMGSLYLARDPAIDRLVVIKVLREGFDDAATRERFAREARAAGRLQHPNIVTVFDVGEHNARPYIAMEFVAGETLAQLIRRRAVGRMWERLAILEELCSGLHYAHAAGIVHRDIKPANVMRDNAGVLKILDFGIARATGANLTREGDVVGTLNYMSPEQLAGEPVDHRTDIYSVGALGYELITTQMAFPGTVQTGVLFKILNAQPVPIDALVPGVDPEVSTIISHAMAKAPDDRYQDLEALRQDLSGVRIRLLETEQGIEESVDPNAETRFDSGRVASGLVRPLSRVASARHKTAVPSAKNRTQVTPAPQSSRNLYLGAAGGLMIVAVAAVSLYLMQGSPNQPARPLPTPPASQPQSAPQPAPPAPSAPETKTPSLPSPSPDQARETVDPVRELRLGAMRSAARQQLKTGHEQGALEALMSGLALDPRDAVLNQMLTDLSRSARDRAAKARDNAAQRGTSAQGSTAYRDGQARESEATRLLRAGDRAAGIRALWSAAVHYDEAAKTIQEAPSPGAEETTRPIAPVDPLPPPSEPVKPAPSPVEKAPPPPPPPPKVEPPATPRDTKADAAAADLAAVRQVLQRYVQAYQALDTGAVGKVMPSLSADQLRSLGRDFSSYRSYSVAIRDESIAVDGATARVTCQVVRSFETKSGVAGSNTVRTVFHLQRAGSDWTIERLESR